MERSFFFLFSLTHMRSAANKRPREIMLFEDKKFHAIDGHSTVATQLVGELATIDDDGPDEKHTYEVVSWGFVEETPILLEFSIDESKLFVKVLSDEVAKGAIVDSFVQVTVQSTDLALASITNTFLIAVTMTNQPLTPGQVEPTAIPQGDAAAGECPSVLCVQCVPHADCL